MLLLRQGEALPAQFAKQTAKGKVDRALLVQVFMMLGHQFVKALHEVSISLAALVGVCLIEIPDAPGAIAMSITRVAQRNKGGCIRPNRAHVMPPHPESH